MKSFFKDYWELCEEKRLENDFSEKEDKKCQL